MSVTEAVTYTCDHCSWNVTGDPIAAGKEARTHKLIHPTGVHGVPDEQEENGEPPARACKIDGCDEPAKDRRGMYDGLCETHRQDKRRAPVKNGNAPLSLVELAQAVEDARRVVEEHEHELAKAEQELARTTNALREALDGPFDPMSRSSTR